VTGRTGTRARRPWRSCSNWARAGSAARAPANWPDNWEKLATTDEIRAYFRSKFESCRGLSEAEREAIAASVRVKGVLPPYRPLAGNADGEYVLTTSRWRFAGAVLPTSLKVRGTPLLAEPMSVTVTSGGNASVWTPRNEPVVRARSETEVVLEQSGVCGPVALTLTGTLMYDGIMLFTLALRPEEAATVQELRLRIPFRAAAARYIRYDTLRGGGGETKAWQFGFGEIPGPSQEVETSYKLLNGRWKNEWRPTLYAGGKAVIWSWTGGVFLPFVWVGDERNGLAWFAESDRGWHYAAGDATCRIERDGDVVAAVFTFVARPTTLTHERTIRFGIQATPPKPVHANWARLRFAGTGSGYVKRGGVQAEFFRPGTYLASCWHSLWSEGCSTPRVKRPGKLKEFTDGCHAAGIKVFPYLAPTHIELSTPEGWRHAATTREWAKLPYQESLPTSLADPDRIIGTVKTCVNSFFAEWLAKGVGDLIDGYDIDGIYFDCCTVRGCANAAHGCGWIDASGTRRPEIPFLAMRRFFMMVRHEFVKRGKTPLIWCHGAEYPGQISSVDFSVLGEGCYGLDHTRQISLGEMRANFIGPNQLGFVRVFLPQFNHGFDSKQAYRPEVTRRLLALTLLHGAKAWWIFCNAAPFADAANALDKLGPDRVEFTPYWEWLLNERLNGRRIYASLYKGSRAALIALSNLSDQDAEVKLTPAELRDAFPGFTTITDPLDKAPVERTPDGVRVRVGRRNLRVLLLE